MKQFISIPFLFIISIILVSCGGKEELEDKMVATKIQAKTFLKTISTADFKRKIKQKETGAIYIGRASCTDCQAFQPVLQKELKARQIKKMDYYDVEIAAKANQTEMISFLKGIDVDSVPTLVYLDKGKITSIYKASSSKQDLQKWLDQHAH
ncbi:thioredoxin family protein [Listeria sp. PSOL-1]|uniref:thioredoxin family protein n=1 Tax=Listeria sp. PSOL-1 TaxID=1844999 RepID=UPI0013D8D93E|nr:thioredoxin family protein [Listeria sp. PSOL-1]